MNREYIKFQAINSNGIKTKIYGNNFFILDAYGFGICDGKSTNRIVLYSGKFASDKKVNKTQLKFLQSRNIENIVSIMRNKLNLCNFYN